MVMKKKISAAIMALAMIVTAAGCGNSEKRQAAIEKYGSATMNLFICGEYLGENVIKNFEKEYGVKVNVNLFNSNEDLYTQLQVGEAYDCLVPSDYMIERLMSEGFLAKLDKSLIPNMSVLPDDLKVFDYDSDNDYSVPYFYGSVGLVYNHNVISEAEIKEQGFNILKNTKYKSDIFMYDSQRDGFMIALKSLGYSANTEDEKEIEEAYQWLLEMNNTMDPTYVTDTVIDAMCNGTKDIAVVYSGDAVTILSENEDMSYYAPESGTNVWCDGFVIPANANNPLLAHEFINYMLSYDAALDNSVTVGYTSTNKDVQKYLSENDFAGNEAYLTDTSNPNYEIFHDVEKLREKIATLWTKVKAQ